MATVAQVIARSLRALGAISSGETPSTQEYSDALESLNGMFASWSASPQSIYAPTQVTYSVPVSTASFTIGSGADVDTTRPKEILSAYIRDSGGTDYPLKIRALSEYERISNKTTTGIPTKAFVRKGYTNWTVYFDYVTSAAYTLYLELLQPLPTFSATTDTFNLPGEYEDAAVYNLAVRISPEYPNSSTILIVSELAKQTLDAIEVANLHPVEQVASMPFSRPKRYDINAG